MSSWPPPESAAAPALACYRHPRVPAPVTCTRCERPICTDCMVSAPVGWQCPSCLKGAPKVRRMRDIQAGGFVGGARPYLTYTLMAICVAVYVAQQGSSSITNRFDIVASGVVQGEWWRVVTSGFLHEGPFHLLINLLLLFQLGRILEERVGRARLFGLFFLSLVGGSVGALLLQEPNQGALGVSGAIFGLMAAWLVLSRRNRSPIDSGIAVLLGFNLVFSFISPGVSLGGHLGGAAAGALGGLVIRLVGERLDVRRVATTTAILLALTAGLFLTAGPVAQARCDSVPARSASGCL